MFFFSSRRRHTRFDCDWSSDVCSSDLVDVNIGSTAFAYASDRPKGRSQFGIAGMPEIKTCSERAELRSEERRVGKSVDLGGRRIIKKKKRTSRSAEWRHESTRTPRQQH